MSACRCGVTLYQETGQWSIDYCPMHKAAPQMLRLIRNYRQLHPWDELQPEVDVFLAALKED